jgi:hypothetical protein
MQAANMHMKEKPCVMLYKTTGEINEFCSILWYSATQTTGRKNVGKASIANALYLLNNEMEQNSITKRRKSGLIKRAPKYIIFVPVIIPSVECEMTLSILPNM